MNMRELAAWTLVLLLALVALGGVVLAVSSSAVDRITVHYADGSVQDFVPEAPPATLTPSPTATLQVTASATPTVPPTNTPRPTFTASPTPVPSSATPTQEIVTWTPQPTTTPPPRCWVKNVDYTINLRAQPRTTAAIVEHVQRGEVQELFAVQDGTQGYGYLWARTFVDGVGGWFVIRQRSSWWVYSLGAETQACVDVPGWPGSELPPEINPPPPTPTATPRPPQTRAALLFHAVPGANSWEMQQAWQVLAGKGIVFGVKAVNEPALGAAAQSMGGIYIARSVHPSDCPAGTPGGAGNVRDPASAARDWLHDIGGYVFQGARPDYIEIVNECYLGDPQSDLSTMRWWDAFFVEAIAEAQRLGWPPLALPSVNPGVGDLAFWTPFQATLRALRNSGGVLSVHNYGINEPYLVPCNVWTSCRHRMTHDALVALGVGDLPIAITEVARGAGDLPPDVGDFVAWWAVVSNDAGLHSVALWTAGEAGAWPLANLNGHMVQIAQGVQ